MLVSCCTIYIIFSFKANMSIQCWCCFFCCLTAISYKIQDCVLKMSVAYNVACKDIFREPETLLNLMPSSLPFLSCLNSSVTVFSHVFFILKVSIYFFIVGVMCCFTSPLPLELHIIPVFIWPFFLSMFDQIGSGIFSRMHSKNGC